MNISLEEIISMVVKEVISELSKKGINIENEVSHASGGIKTQNIIKMDFKEYKTPLLTEAQILEVDLNTPIFFFKYNQFDFIRWRTRIIRISFSS